MRFKNQAQNRIKQIPTEAQSKARAPSPPQQAIRKPLESTATPPTPPTVVSKKAERVNTPPIAKGIDLSKAPMLHNIIIERKVSHNFKRQRSRKNPSTMVTWKQLTRRWRHLQSSKARSLSLFAVQTSKIFSRSKWELKSLKCLIPRIRQILIRSQKRPSHQKVKTNRDSFLHSTIKNHQVLKKPSQKIRPIWNQNLIKAL